MSEQNNFGAETSTSPVVDQMLEGFEHLAETAEEVGGQAPDTAAPSQPTEPAAATPGLPPEEQRYRSLQGMYNRVDEDLRQARQERESLQAELERIKAEGAAQATAQQYELTEEERSKLKGFDNFDLIEKMVAAKAFEISQNNVAKPLSERTAQLERELAEQRQLASTAAETSFSGQLEAKHPGYIEMSHDPAFQAFANQKESPFSQTTIGTRLATAYDARDAATVDRILSAYKSSNGQAVKNPVNAMQAPPASSSRPASPSAAPPTQAQIPGSRFAAVVEQFKSGKISEADLDAATVRWQRLKDQGKVDMSK